jgi:CPA1 family monovalent cation:H+ antiporter
MRYLAGWEWMSALFFGALIAATDPVSVIATLKEARVRGRLRLLIEAESLFNDGTAAVVFGVVVIAATGSTLSVSGVAKTLVVSVGGGILCGGLMAGVLLLLPDERRTISFHPDESTRFITDPPRE